MSRYLLPALIALNSLAAPALAQEAHLMRYADVHLGQIVFTYENDLWLVSSTGGEAHRITRHAGNERYAKFSPDGSRIAFTAEYDGGRDVYVMDARGGTPTRLTYHPSSDRVLGWHPDGQSVLFRSRREHPTRAEQVYLVPVTGGMPTKVAVPRAGLASLSPDAAWLAYNRLSREDRTWKRYQGGTAQDVWMANLATNEHYRITDWVGSDHYPMWIGGRIYFTSDRAHGNLNLFAYDTATGQTFPATDFADYDVKYPSDGPTSIVFQHAETLHLLDLATGEVRPVPITIPSDRTHMRPTYVGVDRNVRTFGLSPIGTRLLIEARGEIVHLPVDEGRGHDLTRSSGSREKDPVWSSDGQWIAFISDRSGEEEVYLVAADGSGWRQVSQGGLGYRTELVWSPDGAYLLFSDKFMRLNLLDVDRGELSVIDQGAFDDAWERWGIQDYVWSPDSRWVAYTKMELNMHESIFLFSVDRREITRVTSDWTRDWSPSFDPGGDHLYFLSDRSFDPIMGRVDQNHVFLELARPYMILLRDDLPSPFAHDDPRDPGIGAPEDEEEDETTATRIDLDGLDRRTLAVPGVDAGNLFRLQATESGFLYLHRPEHVFLKYQVVTDETSSGFDLYGYDLEDDEAARLVQDVGNYHLSADGEQMVYRKGSKFYVVEAGEEPKDPEAVDVGRIRIHVDREAEYAQIFDEAWRVQRDWFYDPELHGVDWPAMKDKYRVFLPYCGNRGDLNYLIGEMIAELNIGHAYVWGGDYQGGGTHVSTAMLGVDLDTPEGAAYHRIAHVVPGTTWNPDERSPLAGPECDVSDGDYLIAIDGQEVPATDNVWRHLQDKRKRLVEVTTNSSPSMDGSVSCLVEPLGNEDPIRYREWVEGRRAMIDQLGGGRVGYVHIPNMGGRGLSEFEAMILDVRRNGGGFTGDMIIDRLERRVWAFTQPREGAAGRNPERGFIGPLVLLIDHDSGSNAEFFSEAIKRKGLATLIGTRTWGGAIGIEPHQDLVDGGMTTPPQFAIYGLDRQWLIEGHGVEPHIEVWNTPDSLARGEDTQVNAAVDYLLQQLAATPAGEPPKPAYPDRSKPVE